VTSTSGRVGMAFTSGISSNLLGIRSFA
jgi:hypothetical protein